MTTLERLVALELARPAPEPLAALTGAVLDRWGDAVSCILFYGSRRRDAGTGGLADLYVLTDSYRRLHRRRVAVLFNQVLPPNVVFLTATTGGGTLGAKVAVMSRRSFARRMGRGSLDTTLWTRFCQPASLLYARDAMVADWVAVTIAEGIRTAAYWGAKLAGPEARPEDRWRALFAATYRLEIRPESVNRSILVHQAARSWFDAVGAASDIATQDTARFSWMIRRIIGKPLNLLRLVKAAFTFEGGADYLAGKLGRHTGIIVVPTDWQRDHPLLGAASLLLRYRRLRRS